MKKRSHPYTPGVELDREAVCIRQVRPPLLRRIRRCSSEGYTSTGVSVALTRFFKRLTYCFMRNTRHNFQFHQLVRQQP